jgi:predicted metal-binding protein
MNDYSNIEKFLETKGITDFKWIDPKEIIVAQWVRVKCQFGCSDYCLGTCPPNTPSVQECKDFFSEYDHGVIIRLTKWADKKAYPSEWSEQMTKKLLEIERQVFLSGNHKAFLLNQTCCDVCQDCPGTRIDCKDKKNARPSPEGFAVDVYQTVRNSGMEINVVSENPSDINRIAILLID